MKASVLLISLLAAGTLAGCADLGFGVDVGSSSPYYGGYYSPYYYDDGFFGSPYYGFNYPFYNTPPAPPLVGNGPCSIFDPNPGRAIRPPQRPPLNGSNPGPVVGGSVNIIPGAGAGTRPGNGGLPSDNPASIPVGRPLRGR